MAGDKKRSILPLDIKAINFKPKYANQQHSLIMPLRLICDNRRFELFMTKCRLLYKVVFPHNCRPAQIAALECVLAVARWQCECEIIKQVIYGERHTWHLTWLQSWAFSQLIARNANIVQRTLYSMLHQFP